MDIFNYYVVLSMENQNYFYVMRSEKDQGVKYAFENVGLKLFYSYKCFSTKGVQKVLGQNWPVSAYVNMHRCLFCKVTILRITYTKYLEN